VASTRSPQVPDRALGPLRGGPSVATLKVRPTAITDDAGGKSLAGAAAAIGAGRTRHHR